MSEVEIVRVDGTNVERYIELVEGLANYEHLEPPSDEAKARLVRDATADEPPFNAYLAVVDDQAVGYVTFFFTYSTFLARPALFLEDIFVREEFRGRGIGTKLFQFCVGVAKRKGCGRMEWTALDWNAPAHRFYEGFGARRLDWFLFRLAAQDFDGALDCQDEVR